MLKEVKHVTYGHNNTPVNIKVGIHCGSVIAGLIGNHKP